MTSVPWATFRRLAADLEARDCLRVAAAWLVAAHTLTVVSVSERWLAQAARILADAEPPDSASADSWRELAGIAEGLSRSLDPWVDHIEQWLATQGS